MHNSHYTTGPQRPVFFGLPRLTRAHIRRLADRARRVANTQSVRALKRLFPLLLVAPAMPAAGQGMLLPTAELSIAGYAITAEIAATEASRSNGLMNRNFLPSNHGMLFVFERANMACFWMKNTPLPLSIAFINEQASSSISPICSPHPGHPLPLRPVPSRVKCPQGCSGTANKRAAP